MNYELWIMNYELWIMNYELSIGATTLTVNMLTVTSQISYFVDIKHIWHRSYMDIIHYILVCSSFILQMNCRNIPPKLVIYSSNFISPF